MYDTEVVTNYLESLVYQKQPGISTNSTPDRI